MEEEFTLETSEARFHTPPPLAFLSKEILRRQKKLGDTPKNVQQKPETNIAEMTSEITKEDPARYENPTDEMPIFHPDLDEPEMSDTDDPNVSGLSHLDPDPSLGCLPRGVAKQRSTTRTYVTPEKLPQLKAWNYLTKRNIIKLFEDMTVEIFYHRFPSPIDFMIEATDKARMNHQDDNYAEESSPKKKSSKDRGIDTLNAKDVSGVASESGVRLFPSQEEYIKDVIILSMQDDVSAPQDKADDEADKDDVSVCTLQDETDGDVTTILGIKLASGDYAHKFTCFPINESLPVELELETEVGKCDAKSPADEDESQSPRIISSVEAFKLLSYLS